MPWYVSPLRAFFFLNKLDKTPAMCWFTSLQDIVHELSYVPELQISVVLLSVAYTFELLPILNSYDVQEKYRFLLQVYFITYITCKAFIWCRPLLILLVNYRMINYNACVYYIIFADICRLLAFKCSCLWLLDAPKGMAVFM